MTTNTYIESVDWDTIYSAFHDPKGIADRISLELENDASPLLFCGFPETGSYLAAERPLMFVDYSPIITTRSRGRYPNIQQIITGEIAEVLKGTPTRNVIISCRLSAFWQSPQIFEKLSCALLSFPRDQVLIDFFDRDDVHKGMNINFESKAGTGNWNFKNITGLPPDDSLIQIANMDISYAVGSTHFSYETQRAFF